MGNISSASHEEILSIIRNEFDSHYKIDKEAFDQVFEQILSGEGDPSTAVITYQEKRTNCILVLLNDYLVIVETAKTPSVLDVIELENEDENVFGPIQRTGVDFQVKITSALNTSNLVKFKNLEAMKQWEVTLNDVRKRLKNDNLIEKRSQTTLTNTLENDPLENIGNSVIAVSNQDVHWSISKEGIVDSGDVNVNGETKESQNSIQIKNSMADVQEALSKEMLPVHQDHKTAGVSYYGLLTELRGHALTTSTKHPKWAEIVDDVFIYYDWDKSEIPEHHEKCNKSPKFIDLELIEAAHVGVLKRNDSIFGACCGGSRNLQSNNATIKGKDSSTNDSCGFSIIFVKHGKRVAATFLTATISEAETWVKMINECKPCNPSDIGKNFETFENFMENCNNGDILLFRGKKINNKLLRSITRSKYDHVGLVVRGPAGPYLFDATGDGICLHTFKKFARKRWYEPYQYVCRRALKWKNTDGKDIEMPKIYIDKLHKFVEKTVGMHYRLTPGALMNHTSKSRLRKKKGYFCSELVAAAYQHMNILPMEPQAQKYWPGTFQCSLASWDKFNSKMDECIKDSGDSNSIPTLDRVERKILWTGENIIPSSKRERGGCFG